MLVVIRGLKFEYRLHSTHMVIIFMTILRNHWILSCQQIRKEDMWEKKTWQKNAHTLHPHKTFQDKLNTLGLTNGKTKAKTWKQWFHNSSAKFVNFTRTLFRINSTLNEPFQHQIPFHVLPSLVILTHAWTQEKIFSSKHSSMMKSLSH